MTQNKDTNDFHDDLETVVEEQDEFTETELEDTEAHSKDTIKLLKNKLKEAEKEKMEALENLQRAKAEFLNARRRLEAEREVDKERITDKHIEKLLPLCDSFFMAQSNKEAWESLNPTWKKGIESIIGQLQSLLASYKVSEVHPEGVLFDPEAHEALMHVPVLEESLDHTVVTVIQNGYVRTTGDKITVIRPARVSVGEYRKN